MHWRRFAVADIPLDDQGEFEVWLRERWTEKDQLLQQCFETGRFPTKLAGSIDTANAHVDQKAAASAGYIEAHVQLSKWYEAARIFMVLVGMRFLCKLAAKVYGVWNPTT